MLICGAPASAGSYQIGQAVGAGGGTVERQIDVTDGGFLSGAPSFSREAGAVRYLRQGLKLWPVDLERADSDQGGSIHFCVGAPASIRAYDATTGEPIEDFIVIAPAWPERFPPLEVSQTLPLVEQSEVVARASSGSAMVPPEALRTRLFVAAEGFAPTRVVGADASGASVLLVRIGSVELVTSAAERWDSWHLETLGFDFQIASEDFESGVAAYPSLTGPGRIRIDPKPLTYQFDQVFHQDWNTVTADKGLVIDLDDLASGASMGEVSGTLLVGGGGAAALDGYGVFARRIVGDLRLPPDSSQRATLSQESDDLLSWRPIRLPPGDWEIAIPKLGLSRLVTVSRAKSESIALSIEGLARKTVVFTDASTGTVLSRGTSVKFASLLDRSGSGADWPEPVREQIYPDKGSGQVLLPIGPGLASRPRRSFTVATPVVVTQEQGELKIPLMSQPLLEIVLPQSTDLANGERVELGRARLTAHFRPADPNSRVLNWIPLELDSQPSFDPPGVSLIGNIDRTGPGMLGVSVDGGPITPIGHVELVAGERTRLRVE